MEKSVFKASFEDSLNIEDDVFLQYQLNEQKEKMKRFPKKGFSSFKIRVLSFFLTLLFPIGTNFLFLVFSLSLHDSNPADLKAPISSYPLLTIEVYFTCLMIWLVLVILGKLIKRTYFLPYRYRFHIDTYIIWLSLEFNLLAIDISLSTLSFWGIVIFFGVILFLAYTMFTGRVREIKSLLFETEVSPSRSGKIARILASYGMTILGLAVLFKTLLSAFSIKLSDSLVGLGLLFTWFIMNLALFALMIYIEFPFFIQAYYKWKYPEEYREWEGKTLEEWYGKKYLKKHKELLENE